MVASANFCRSEINRLRLEYMATACERIVTRCHWLDATKEGALLTGNAYFRWDWPDGHQYSVPTGAGG